MSFVQTLKVEASKPGIAPTNAFVLVEWCSLLIQLLAGTGDLWKTCGIEVINADAQVLELCIGSTVRNSVKGSALVVTRRGLRKLFSTESVGEEAISSVVKHLTTKGASSNARNAVLLGVVAGVCVRLPSRKCTLEGFKDLYFTFYTREIIGSRTIVPQHLATALHDFFNTFMSAEDLQAAIVPSLEKALLRAPEIILNDLLSPLIHSTAIAIDFSEILLNNLLKPLLANIKSTNSTIRTGATNAFGAVAARCHNETLLEKIADEMLLPLKQSKVTAAEQRQLHAQMLSSLPGSPALSQQIPKGLAVVAIKEPNEPALGAQILAIVKHLTGSMSLGLEVDRIVLDAFDKGLKDKRGPVRRLWALGIGDLLWDLSDSQMNTSSVVTLIEATLGNLLAIFNEVVESPLPAAQNGLAAAAYVLTALSGSKFNITNSVKVEATLKKANVLQKALAVEPKPSFLLNHRIYTKLTSKEDSCWAVRALRTVSTGLVSDDATSTRGDAWAQAFLFFITSLTVPPSIRADAANLLSRAYTAEPATIAKVIVKGIWHWRRRVENVDRDSAAIAARSNNDKLYLGIRSICLPPGVIEKMDATVDSEILKEQLVNMLVLCRPEIVPRVDWISTVLRAGVDPGTLVQERPARCMDMVNGFAMVRPPVQINLSLHKDIFSN